ncbi:hypothetical protein HPB49_021272 [Dermacentor silvarum]|uniref:Uncharacterized protein n=1 Tax=Dermacentor silvarum TaxID=543639 RepID=A0ACB8E3I6_DERSI|nr:hypothetical protein HPB49_021272 [Dermacentor silvarum]
MARDSWESGRFAHVFEDWRHDSDASSRPGFVHLSGRDLFAWVKEAKEAVELCGFVVVRIVTNNYFANKTMFKLLGNGCFSTTVSHPLDNDRVIFLSFDPCHILKNIRSQFLERTLTDGSGMITGTFVQQLYEFQKHKTVKLARNLT